MGEEDRSSLNKELEVVQFGWKRRSTLSSVVDEKKYSDGIYDRRFRLLEIFFYMPIIILWSLNV